MEELSNKQDAPVVTDDKASASSQGKIGNGRPDPFAFSAEQKRRALKNA
jgi:hypothetical protein